jgi:Flp pilus assembly protein TadD
MSPRSICAALLLAVACLASGPLCADEVQDIERLYRAGDIEQAMRRADAALTAQPRAAQIRFLKGVMLNELKRSDEARDIFIALTQDFPELSDPYNNLAVIYAASGKLQDALNALQGALRADPTHRAARENLGDIHMALAIQAWAVAQAADKEESAELNRKLRLARGIQTVPASPVMPRSPG